LGRGEKGRTRKGRDATAEYPLKTQQPWGIPESAGHCHQNEKRTELGKKEGSIKYRDDGMFGVRFWWWYLIGIHCNKECEGKSPKATSIA